MLTLTRKVGETIRIGDDIEIVVKEIRKNQVRIGIVAPREVKIYREEVYDNIVAEQTSTTTPPQDTRTVPLKPAATAARTPRPRADGQKPATPDDEPSKSSADG